MERETPADNVENIVKAVEHLFNVRKSASSRKTRLEDLMSRKKAKKWSAEKKAKMARRLSATYEAINAATSGIQEANTLLPDHLRVDL